jgi:TnpA family transposase
MPGLETGTYGAVDAAFAEYGRIAKTEHLLRVVDPVDDTYRPQMNRQSPVQESGYKPARDVCDGKRGTIHQAYGDGMEGQRRAGPGPQRHGAVDHEVHRRRRCPAEWRGS